MVQFSCCQQIGKKLEKYKSGNRANGEARMTNDETNLKMVLAS